MIVYRVVSKISIFIRWIGLLHFGGGAARIPECTGWDGPPWK
jgi:hypothetical protein